ncbi:MAG: hypothetical protein EOO88_60715, partial [Pedobacter sp.]
METGFPFPHTLLKRPEPAFAPTRVNGDALSRVSVERYQVKSIATANHPYTNCTDTMLRIRTVLLLSMILCTVASNGQDSTLVAHTIPEAYLKGVSRKANQLNAALDKKTNQALNELAAMETKLSTKLSKVNPEKAATIFDEPQKRMAELTGKMKGAGLTQYLPSLDSMESSLKFLEMN